MREKYRKAIFMLVYAENQGKQEYLILKRKLHWRGWEFPKGGLEILETKKRAIKREIKEETGLEILKIKKEKIKGKYRYKKELEDRKGITGQTYDLYSVLVKKKKVKLDKNEHSDFKWVDFKTALKKLTWPNQRKCLRYFEKI